MGSYGSVEELQVKGLVCAGKRMHETLLQRDNQGVINIERKYFEECQVRASHCTTGSSLISRSLYLQQLTGVDGMWGSVYIIQQLHDSPICCR